MNLTTSSDSQVILLLKTREHHAFRCGKWGCHEDKCHTECLTPENSRASRSLSELPVGLMISDMRAAKDVSLGVRGPDPRTGGHQPHNWPGGASRNAVVAVGIRIWTERAQARFCQRASGFGRGRSIGSLSDVMEVESRWSDGVFCFFRPTLSAPVCDSSGNPLVLFFACFPVFFLCAHSVPL